MLHCTNTINRLYQYNEVYNVVRKYETRTFVHAERVARFDRRSGAFCHAARPPNPPTERGDHPAFGGELGVRDSRRWWARGRARCSLGSLHSLSTSASVVRCPAPSLG